MPEVFPIQQFLFQNLLRDFQVLAPPRSPVWYLSDTVIPVSLVNSQITLQANFADPAMIFATEGRQVGPPINKILADTGALDPGVFTFRLYFACNEDAKDNEIVIEHRNPGDTANIWDFSWQHERNTSFLHTFDFTETFVDQERLRIRINLAGTAGKNYQAFIWRRAA